MLLGTRLLLILLIALAGCASSQGLHPERLWAILEQEEVRFAGAPSSAVNPPRATTPTLGLYLKPTRFLNRGFEWTDRDRETVLTWSNKLHVDSGRKSTGYVHSSSLKGETLTELRTTAARYGYDWLLIIDAAAAIDRYNNYKAALLYWTFLGTYLADGTQADALCIMKATVWDVKTGASLIDEQAEGMTKRVGPAALVDDSEEIERARQAAMDVLLQRLGNRLSALTGTGQ